MSKRGEPKITPANSGDSNQPAQEYTFLGMALTLLFLFVVLPIAFWIVTSIWGFVSSIFESNVTTRPAAPIELSVATPTTSTSTGASQTYYRVLSSTKSSGADIVVVLASGDYSISIDADRDSSQISSLLQSETFFVNLSTGIKKGNIISAKNIVIYGNANLKISDIGELDSFIANIRDRGPIVSAYFDYSRSPRGPPAQASKTRRKVFLVGNLEEIVLPDAYGSARATIGVMALGPKYWRSQDIPLIQSQQTESSEQRSSARPQEDRIYSHPSTTRSRGK